MSSPDPLIGKTLEKCRLLEKLGTGGMGSVYLAEHFGLNRKVAVKILPPDMSRDPEYVARFMREATTAGRLEHPNIVQVYDVGYAENRHFIVMQYVEGESLSTAVEALGALDPRDAARIVAGVLRGLHHAHEQGVVHRDVKPDNILLARGDQPKLLDFGLAIETEGALKLTKDGLVVGTPYYLSPEQARGHRATPRSDIYSCGVLLYYLVTGKRPFVGATALAVLNKHIREKPIPPAVLNPRVPKPLNDIILTMMAKRPEDRYPTAAAAADDLENFLADRPVTARSSERIPWIPPRWRLAGLVAAGFLALASALALASRACRTAPVAPLPAAGPAVPAPPAPEPPPIGNLEQIVNLDLRKRETPASWTEVLRQYDSFILANQGTRHADRARQLRAQFLESIETEAQKILDKLPADPVSRAEALQAIPPEVLDLTSIGGRVRSERARLSEILRRRLDDQKALLDRSLEEGDFRMAESLLLEMLRYADPERKRALLKLREELPERERSYNDPALRRLQQAYASSRQTFEAALVERKTAEAYAVVTGFLKARREAGERNLTRVRGVNYETLLALSLGSTTDPFLLAEALRSISAVWNGAESTLAYQILGDLQDAIDLEWVLQKAGSALRSLISSPGKSIPLRTFGTEGRILLNPAGLRFQAGDGREWPLSLPRLDPEDIVQLAALEGNPGAEPTPPADQGPLARAAGVCFRYSTRPDRWFEAARWFARAAELGAGGPPGRPEEMRERGRRQVRETLALVQQDIVGRRYDAARRALEDLESLAARDADLRREVGSVQAALLASELRQAFEGRSYLRVKELTRLLRDRYPGLYEEETVADLYHQTLWITSTWRRDATELGSPFWDWEGRKEGRPAPAADEGFQGLRLSAGQRLFVNPQRSGTITGLWVQARVNPPAPTFTAGIQFDVAGPGGKYRLLALTPHRIGFAEGSEVGLRWANAAALPRKIQPGEWIGLALIVEGEELIGYLEGKAVCAARAQSSPPARFALYADTDTNFRAVQIRK